MVQQVALMQYVAAHVRAQCAVEMEICLFHSLYLTKNRVRRPQLVVLRRSTAGRASGPMHDMTWQYQQHQYQYDVSVQQSMYKVYPWKRRSM